MKLGEQTPWSSKQRRFCPKEQECRRKARAAKQQECHHQLGGKSLVFSRGVQALEVAGIYVWVSSWWSDMATVYVIIVEVQEPLRPVKTKQ